MVLRIEASVHMAQNIVIIVAINWIILDFQLKFELLDCIKFHHSTVGDSNIHRIIRRIVNSEMNIESSSSSLDSIHANRSITAYNNLKFLTNQKW